VATVDREEIIISKDYERLCDFTWVAGMTTPPTSGIISVPMEHFQEFIKICGDTPNSYVVVSQRSDLGLAYQKEYPVQSDMKKWITMLPYMGSAVCDFDSLGYAKLVIPPRCDLEKCNIQDNYSIKCDSFTWATIPCVPDNIKRWYMTNCMAGEPRLSSIPFGILNDESADKICSTPEVEKRKWLYVNFHTYTMERFFLKSHWSSRQITDEHFMTFIAEAKPVEEYFKDISEHHYVLCPDGNGIDCFRTWEALYLGSIPIVKRSRVTEQFADLPVLIVDDLFNITHKSLLEKHEEVLSKKDNLEKVKLSYWNKIFKESRNESCD